MERVKGYSYLVDDAGLRENDIGVDSLRETYEEFVKKNRKILRLQQRFRNKKNNLYNKEV